MPLESNPRPVRVLQLGSPNGMFGAERWILALLKYLPRDRVQTVVGVIKDDPDAPRPPLLGHAESQGFETALIDAPGRLSAAAVGALRRLIREQRIDVLHSHFYKTTILGALAVRGTDCRLLATPHGWNTDAGFKLQAYEWAERVAFGWCDAVAPLSAELARGLTPLPWLRGKVTLIPNGVDLSEVTACDEVAAEVRAVRDEGAFVVGYIGQLIGRKRVDTLIDAFAALPLDRKHLYIVGDGPDRAALAQRAESAGIGNQVTFTGFREDRLAYLRGFDAIVLPSLLEGIPRCLMEAMAAGAAMVATDIDGTRELVLHDRTGLLFAPGQSRVLADHLASLAREPARRQRLVAAARERVHAQFSGASMADRYARLFDSLTGRAPADPMPASPSPSAPPLSERGPTP